LRRDAGRGCYESEAGGAGFLTLSRMLGVMKCL
jgi:hypothetical protein